MKTNKKVIISLGGSLIVPNEIDISFLKSFKTLIEKEISQNGREFVIITGGGKVCRKYQDSAKAIVEPSKEDLDWIGIGATRINAELLRVIFGELAHEQVIVEDGAVSKATKPVVIGAGRVPGHSSDFDAILMAEESGALTVINLSNIDYAYDKDPNKYPDAKKIEKISWSEFRKLLPEKWEPGLSSPFDPIAAKHAQDLGLEVVIMNGSNLENLSNYLDGKNFLGTVISE
jgi:uridylate kinase